MEKMTFRETMILSEARKPDLVYKEKVVKNKVDRVIVELEGSQSGAMTRLASRYDRLEKAIKKMGEKRDELNAKIKEQVEELFAPEDVVLTRVVETVSFTMTLSKLVKSEEQEPKKVVKYDKIAEELAKLIPDELQAQVDAIVAKYTEISIAAEKSPALRVKSKVDESLNEGVFDLFKSIGSKIAKWLKDTAKWAVSYDKKLDALKKKASSPITEAKAKTPIDDSPLGQLKQLPQPIGINGGSYTYWVDVTKTPLKFVASDGSVLTKAKTLEDIAKWMDRWAEKIWLNFLKGNEDLEGLKAEGIVRTKKGRMDQAEHEAHMRG